MLWLNNLLQFPLLFAMGQLLPHGQPRHASHVCCAQVATSLQIPFHWNTSTNTPPVKPFAYPGLRFFLMEELSTGAQTPQHFSIQGMGQLKILQKTLE